EDADANTGADRDGMALDLERLPERIEHHLRGPLRIAPVLDAVEDQRKFVAADASQRVRLPVADLQALRHPGQHRVPRVVTETVIHQLEAVQVDMQQREERLIALRL